MLSFLNALCTALVARDAGEVRRLIGRPGTPPLPREVRDEIAAWLEAPGAAAPVRTLHHYHQTRQLLLAEPGELSAEDQLELSLGPLDHRFGGSVSIARAAHLDRERRHTPVTPTRAALPMQNSTVAAEARRAG